MFEYLTLIGKELTIFERRFAKLIGTKYAVGVNSGTDVETSLKAMNIKSGDEVITAANTLLRPLVQLSK